MSNVLDGNALAGDLATAFGREMTSAAGKCHRCGARSMVAELRVYMGGPGAVGRCPSCGDVVMVLVTIAGECRVHLPALTLQYSRNPESTQEVD